MSDGQENQPSSTYFDSVTFESLISILRMFEEDRSLNDLHFLRETLGKIAYFGQLEERLDEDVQLNLVKEIRLQELNKEDAVFYTGEPGTHFFMLLQGSVYIIKESTLTRRITNSKKQVSRDRQALQRLLDYEPSTKDNDKSDGKNIPILLDIKKDDPILSQEDLLQLFPGHLVLNILYAPNYFGEIALNESLPRTATVVCREKCYLATLKRSTYLRVLIEHVKKRDKEKLTFFKALPLLKSWPSENISALIRNIEVIKFKYGQAIFKQNDDVKELFFIKSGTVELTKDIEVDVCNIDQSFVNSPTFNKVSYNTVQLFKSINPHWKRKVRRKECVRVAVLSTGEVLGDLDVARMARLRECTAKCLSDAVELYKLDRKMLFLNSSAPEEVLYKIRDQNPRKGWRETFLAKIVRRAENKWGNYEKTLAKCQSIDTVQEIKRIVGGTDNDFANLNETEKRSKVIRIKKPLPPFTRTTKSEDTLRMPTLDTTTIEYLSIFQRQTRKKYFMRSRGSGLRSMRVETTNEAEDSAIDHELMPINNIHSPNFNFITTRDSIKHDENLGTTYSIQAIDNNILWEQKGKEIPPLKKIMRTSHYSNKSIGQFSTQPEVLTSYRPRWLLQ